MKNQDPQDENLWKALDAFPEVEPPAQARAHFWARVAKEEHPTSGHFLFWRRWAIPALAFSGTLLITVLGSLALHTRQVARADREIAANIEFYQNYEVLQTMPQLAAYEEKETEVDPFDVTE